jgi:hypothetical protein
MTPFPDVLECDFCITATAGLLLVSFRSWVVASSLLLVGTLSAFPYKCASIGIPIHNCFPCFKCLTTYLYLSAAAALFLLGIVSSIVDVLSVFFICKGYLLTDCSYSYGGGGVPQMQSPYQPNLPMNAANGHGLPGSSDGQNGSNGEGHENAFSQQLP